MRLKFEAPFPGGLTARLVLPLALGLFLLQVGVFMWSVQVRVQEQLQLVISDRARLATTLYQMFAVQSPAERSTLLARLAFQNFSLALAPERPFAQHSSPASLLLQRRLRELLALAPGREEAAKGVVAALRRFDTGWRVTPLPDLLGNYTFNRFEGEAALPLPDGTWLVVRYTAVPHLNANAFGLLAGLTVQFLLQIVLLVATVRYVTRPLRQLTRFAEKLPPDMPRESLDALPHTGSLEVMRMSEAFRAMFARIRHFVEERVRLLACLSHDLRTPLTRLRLQLENEPGLKRPELVFDALDDLERLTEDAITLARTGQNNEPERVTDMVALLESLVADREEYGAETECPGHAANCRVRLRTSGHAVLCRVRPAAFRRCLDNLVDNALRYGERATITLDMVESAAEDGMEPAGERLARIRIEDEGPGIPEAKLEEVFQLFYRLEDSRNTRTGGTGLGLGIARDLARCNHSDIILANRPGGGLTATLLVPLAGNTR